MDIAHLNAFVVVADTGSFSQAAEQLHLSQPAVSKRVSGLEDRLGTRLFDRLGRRVLLTEAGQLLLPRARRVLAELDDGRRALQNLSGQVSGTLTVATSHHIGLHRLPPILRSFVASYPEVQLDMRFTDSELGCDAVMRGDVELAIVTLPPTQSSILKMLPIWDDPLGVVLATSHPLATETVLTAAMLSAYPAILPGNGTFTRRIVEEQFNRLGLEPLIAFSTNYLETIKMMVAIGLGWSVLPEAMAGDELIIRPLEGISIHRTLGTVQHSEHTLSNAAKALLELLQTAP